MCVCVCFHRCLFVGVCVCVSVYLCVCGDTLMFRSASVPLRVCGKSGRLFLNHFGCEWILHLPGSEGTSTPACPAADLGDSMCGAIVLVTAICGNCYGHGHDTGPGLNVV